LPNTGPSRFAPGAPYGSKTGVVQRPRRGQTASGARIDEGNPEGGDTAASNIPGLLASCADGAPWDLPHAPQPGPMTCQQVPRPTARDLRPVNSTNNCDGPRSDERQNHARRAATLAPVPGLKGCSCAPGRDSPAHTGVDLQCDADRLFPSARPAKDRRRLRRELWTNGKPGGGHSPATRGRRGQSVRGARTACSAARSDHRNQNRFKTRPPRCAKRPLDGQTAMVPRRTGSEKSELRRRRLGGIGARLPRPWPVNGQTQTCVPGRAPPTTRSATARRQLQMLPRDGLGNLSCGRLGAWHVRSVPACLNGQTQTCLPGRAPGAESSHTGVDGQLATAHRGRELPLSKGLLSGPVNQDDRFLFELLPARKKKRHHSAQKFSS